MPYSCAMPGSSLTGLGCAIGFYALWALLWKVFYKSYPFKVVKQIFQDGRMFYVISPNLSHYMLGLLCFNFSKQPVERTNAFLDFCTLSLKNRKTTAVFLTRFSVKTLSNLFLHVFAVVTFLEVIRTMFKPIFTFLLTSFSWMIIDFRWRLHKQDDI